MKEFCKIYVGCFERHLLYHTGKGIRPWTGIAGALSVSLLLGAATVLSTDGDLSKAFTQEFADLWITVIAVCLFTALYRVKISPGMGRIFTFGAGGCYGGYLLSHLLDAWCYKLIPEWRTPELYPGLFLCVTIPIFLVSVLSGRLLQIFVNGILNLSFIKAPTGYCLRK